MRVQTNKHTDRQTLLLYIYRAWDSEGPGRALLRKTKERKERKKKKMKKKNKAEKKNKAKK
jgi:hypothetical protein